MEVTARPTPYPAQDLNAKQRSTLALQLIQNNQPVTDIAKSHKVSRKFLYAQKDKAIDAIDDAFSSNTEDDDKVLFYLPVTRVWLCQFILALVLNCRSCFRGVIKTLDDIFDYPISIGTIHNVVNDAIQQSSEINDCQDLSRVTIGAHDELFHQNKPVLAGIDIPSLYCYLLTQEQHRDSDTWGIHILDLVKQGFNPERVIADKAEGLRAGLKIACSHVPCDGDVFHITKKLIDLRRYFRNRLKSRISSDLLISSPPPGCEFPFLPDPIY